MKMIIDILVGNPDYKENVRAMLIIYFNEPDKGFRLDNWVDYIKGKI